MGKNWSWSLDRFNLAPLFQDYWRSLIVLTNGRRDLVASIANFVVPAAMFVLSTRLDWRLPNPAALFGGVALLAGVLLAGFSQIAGFRLRVAERPMGTTPRQSRLFREAVALVLLAALTAIAAAVQLGVAVALPTQPVTQILTGTIVASCALLLLLVIATIRRLYLTYLEVFEDGLLLPKRRRRAEGEPASSSMSDDDFDVSVH